LIVGWLEIIPDTFGWGHYQIPKLLPKSWSESVSNKQRVANFEAPKWNPSTVNLKAEKKRKGEKRKGNDGFSCSVNRLDASGFMTQDRSWNL
jgi:hypothetical protein